MDSLSVYLQLDKRLTRDCWIFVTGLRLWERAMQERFPEDALVDVSLPKVVRQSPVADMLRTTEFASLQELRVMADDPNEIRVQALLVRERILGAAHPETSYLLRYRGAVFADQGESVKSLTTSSSH